MPAWNATYQLRDFAQHILDITARQGGRDLPLRKSSLTRWRAPCAEDTPVTVRYQIAAERPGPFGAYVDSSRAALNLAQVLLYPLDARQEPFTLRFANVPKSWKAALSLSEQQGEYSATSYDRLVDTPVLLGRMHIDEFSIGGKTVRVATHGARGTHNRRLLRDAAQRVSAAAIRVMGEAPFDTYTFAFHFDTGLGGGMEFRDGTLIGGPATCDRCDMAGLAAHEFFHLWNVKRIRDRAMEPVDFERPIDTSTLWFAEGVTSTFAQYILLESKLQTPREFLDHVGERITLYESRPAARTQSAAQSGMEAWFERYPTYGRPERSVSYYLQGELIGYALDLEIRAATENRKSLVDVLRHLAAEGSAGKFFDGNDGLLRAITEATGVNIRPTFDSLVLTSEPVDWARYLGHAGVDVVTTSRKQWTAGLSVANAPGRGTVVATLAPSGPATAAGVEVGDAIVALDGEEFHGDQGDFEAHISELAPGYLSLRVRRQGRFVDLDLKPKAREKRSYRLRVARQSNPLQRAIREGWTERRSASPADSVTAPSGL